MESILLLTFDEPTVARRAMSELRRLDSGGTVAVRTAVVLQRQADGRFRVVEEADNIGLTATASGGLFGALLGALGGPAGVLLGGAAGAVVGAASDADEAGASELLLMTVASRTASGATVVVADAHEPVPDVLDAVVSRLGGELTRRSRDDVEAELEGNEGAG